MGVEGEEVIDGGFEADGVRVFRNEDLPLSSEFIEFALEMEAR